MKSWGALKLAAVVGFAALAIGGMASAPSASFEVSSGHPSAKAPTRFVDRSTGGASAWLWMFGDGRSSTEQSPSHVYEGAGVYPVTLRVSGASGMTETTSVLTVAQEDTLVLLGGIGHAFEITLAATDPRTGNTGTGNAIPQNDVFGYFTIPALVPQPPGAPLVPEVFVKMLDARAIGQDFWVFWGGLTDLTYTLTVHDTVRGTVKTYHNPVTDSIVCLGADTSGFGGGGATPTPTVSVAPTPTPTPSAGQTRHVTVGNTFFRDAVSGNSTTTISVGTEVEWDWQAGFHTTTSGPCPPCTPSGVWDSGGKGSGNFKFTFTQAGTFPYYCGVHTTAMTGSVIVNP
jgi:PKD repeat protein